MKAITDYVKLNQIDTGKVPHTDQAADRAHWICGVAFVLLLKESLIYVAAISDKGFVLYERSYVGRLLNLSNIIQL